MFDVVFDRQQVPFLSIALLIIKIYTNFSNLFKKKTLQWFSVKIFLDIDSLKTPQFVESASSEDLFQEVIPNNLLTSPIQEGRVFLENITYWY